MAISLKTSATWLTLFGGTITPTPPGSPVEGDRYFLWMMWKPYTATSSVPGWTRINLFADGTIGSSDSAGSMTVTCFYRDYQVGDGNVSITMAGVPGTSIGGYVMQLWQKAPSEKWCTPLYASAAWPSQSTGTVNASSNVAVINNSVVMCLMSFCDDTATMTRGATTAISASPALTWTGNYVESPSSHLSSTTNDDAACDLGHRFVTTGHPDTTLSATATIALAKTGAILWVVQSVAEVSPYINSVAVERAAFY